MNAEENFLKVIDEKIGIAEKNAKEWRGSEESELYFLGIAKGLKIAKHELEKLKEVEE